MAQSPINDQRYLVKKIEKNWIQVAGSGVVLCGGGGNGVSTALRKQCKTDAGHCTDEIELAN